MSDPRYRWLILLFLFLPSVCGAWNHKITGPCLYDTRPCDTITPGDAYLSREEAIYCARYDLICSAKRTWEILPIRAINPNCCFLYSTALGSIQRLDYDLGQRMSAFFIPDTLIDPQRKIQKWVGRNLDVGCDWLLRDVAGRPISAWDGTVTVLNWTTRCPIGRVGPTRGLTLAQYTLKAYTECGRVSSFPWNGWCFDTAPEASHGCWAREFCLTDFDRDRRSDGCCGQGTDWGFPRSAWLQDEASQTQNFLVGLGVAFPLRPIILSQRDIFHGPVEVAINGSKMEYFLRQVGRPRSVRWWINEYEACEREIRRPRQPDSRLGGDMTIIHAVMDPSRPLLQEQQYARFSLGLALVFGNGYFACERRDFRSVTIPEEFNWRFEWPALTEAYWKGSVACRDYRTVAGADTVTVWADTLLREAGVAPKGEPP